LTNSSAALAGPAIEASIAAAGKKEQNHITAIVLNGIFIADLLQKKRSPCLMSEWKNFENKTNRSKSVRAIKVPLARDEFHRGKYQAGPHEFVICLLAALLRARVSC
jgi:hypothetical protein